MPRAQVVVSRSIVVAAFTALVTAGGLEAQVRQYTAPGGGPNPAAGREEALEKAVEEARWNAGPLRLDPALWVSDLAWVDSPDQGIDGDLTARAGAGLRAYLPVGGKSTIAAYALPEYLWWKDRDEERRLNQRFGIGSFTYFNRLSIEATARRDENFAFATAESFQKVTVRTDELALALEVPIFRTLAAHAQGASSTYESLSEQAPLADSFSDLDRDDRSWRAGLRYYPTSKLYFGAGVGHSESAFADHADDRSNSGDVRYAEFGYERPKLGLSFDYQQNDLEADAGSSFGSFDGWTGSGRVEWRPRESFAFRVYASRALAYSLGSAAGYLDDARGVGVSFKLGWRLEFDVYAETGELRYEEELGGTGQTSDAETVGASMSMPLFRSLALEVGYRKSTYDGAAGFGDRELEEIRASVSFGLGNGAASWF